GSRKNLQWIEQSARRMLERVDSILVLAKLEAGKLEVFVRPVAVRPLIDAVAEQLKAQIKGLDREIEVVVEVAGDAPQELRSDEEKIRPILINLTSNAAKFTEAGRVTIRVARAGDARVSVAVIYTGVGVPPDRLESIFELYTAGVWRGSGTGIGLALAR